ncbi:VOC family protein [Pannonibacter indicus]|jgi:catechol 2,3-dioxygenase-like lactoylglutathione lyase family enzyme|uniref:Catechol 2,3-dioxygenase or other lactoylglutathione lyase family enzyme n=1 Tax=Pannonibacter indicus TaxID=466044 RepID=A0A0K6HSF9_9HYPH|nr:VOC family protein [Pannonibacter indicus]CUA93703.1 Catechol 2,3-dioxygenase or other lactoylglutathione lyase family enzyme [Pannonibacter indicus]
MNFYITLGTRDLAASIAFYDAVLATVGWASHAQFPGWQGYSKDGKGEGVTVWICEPFNGEPASAGNGTMAAFPAASPQEVDAFHAAAMAHGGLDEGAAGPRPHYGPDWYAAYLRDPSGNKIAAVFNG